MAALAEELKGVPLFGGLSQRQLRRLGRDFKERSFRPGTEIVRQGHMSGVDFFVIIEGEVSVTVDGKEVRSVEVKPAKEHDKEKNRDRVKTEQFTTKYNAANDIRCGPKPGTTPTPPPGGTTTPPGRVKPPTRPAS